MYLLTFAKNLVCNIGLGNNVVVVGLITQCNMIIILIDTHLYFFSLLLKSLIEIT